MIIAKITQDNLELTIQEINIPYQYSQGLEIEFIRDRKYKDYTLLAFYKLEGDMEAKLMECNNDIISIAKDVFKKIGKVSFSFSFTMGEEVIHLGVVEFYIRRAFGSDESILPQEDKNTWMDLIGNIAKDGVDNYWNSFYKEQIDSIVRDINSKVSDASNYANQANTAKVEAQQCATDAGNSASSSLENANKAKEHLDNVTEKVNAFNVDYASKVEDFNSNAENANDALDKKITDANTSIDAKVTEATEQARKAKQEADRAVLATDGKLNKNQGPENAGKAMVVDADGNVVPGSALPDNVYTQEEVDYLLADKMDKPYVDITITDNTTIENTLDGNFKIDSIEGNTVQKIETDIVPTPSRPVPIISKKINVGGEVVELRSLKESSNLFDIKMYGFEVGLLNNNGILQPGFTTYFTSGYIPIKKSTQYMVGILGLDGYTLTGVFFYDQNYNLVAKTDSKPFTTPANSMYVKFGCTKNGGATDEINKHAMLVEGATVPSAYVAPTVRDYKIVDHTNKKSWIERNIQEVNLNNLNFVYNDTKTDYTRFYAPLNPTVKHVGEIYSNSFPSYKSYDYTKESIYGGNTSGGKTLSVIVKDSNVAEHTKEALLDYINNPNAVAYYALETPIVEEIPYLESDTSEFGVSSQDTTSPSPSIKSNIESVKVLNIKACGKNLLNETLAKDYSNYVSLGNGYSKFIVSVKPGTKYVVSRRDTVGLGTNCYVWIKGVASFWMVHTTNENINVNKGYITSTEDGTIEIIIATSNQEKLNQTWDVLGWLQIEEGDTATEYEPYKETVITHTLAKPLLSLVDGSVADIITLENRLNLLSIYTFTGNETFSGSYGEQKGYYGRYFMLNKAYGNMVKKVFCNVLPHVPSSWSVAQESCCQNANQLHLKFSNLRLGIRDDTPIADKQRAFSNYIKEQYDNGTPIEFLYMLKNPIIEPLEASLIEKLKTLMSFYPITHVFSNVPLEFDYKLNMPEWHKVVSGEVEDAKDVIYNMQVQQNNLEVMQLQSALETQYNLDLLKLGGNLC